MSDMRHGRWLEVGCGSHPNENCQVHTDVRYIEGVTDFACNYEEPLPIKSEDFDGVYGQFVLEHISYMRTRPFLREVFRILRPNGRAIFICPNTLAQMAWIQGNPQGWDGKPFFDAASENLFGTLDYPENGHKAFFTPDIVAQLLTEAGFVNIKYAPFGSRQTDMVIEGTKPFAKSLLGNMEVKDVPRETHNPSEKLEVSVLGTNAAVAQTGLEHQPDMLEDAVRKTAASVEIPEPKQPAAPSLSDSYGMKYWENYHGKGPYRDFFENEVILRHLMLRKPKSVLELGCGRGYLLKKIQDLGEVARIVSLDIAPDPFITTGEGILR